MGAYMTVSRQKEEKFSATLFSPAFFTQPGKESKPDENAFDEENYKKALNAGFKLFHEDNEKHHLYVDRIKSYAPGFGTAVMRYFAERSLENKNLDGNLELDASWSSHLFYLYMGMIPVDRPINYVSHQYGLMGSLALQKLTTCKNEKSLSQHKQLAIVIDILSEETGLEKSALTDKDVLEYRDYLLGLQGKTVSFLSVKFIPDILSALENNIGNKRPDTEWMGSVKMILSVEGKARWKDVIERKINFKQFKNFEQLLPYMSDAQKSQLKSICEEAAGLKIRPISNNS